VSQEPPARDSISLPVRIEDITADWLSAALSVRQPGVKVAVAEHENVILGTAAKVKLRLEYNAAGRAAGLPQRLWVKLGLEGEHRRMIASVYRDEMRFFRDVQPLLGVNAPTCYFAGHDAEVDQYIVILEDLTSRGARIWRAIDNLTFKQAAAFLDVQAAYHARYWDSPELEEGGSLGWITCLGEDRTTMAYVAAHLVPETWAMYMAQPRGVVLPRVLQDRDWMRRAFDELMEINRRRPYCLLHGDPHIGNMYSEADGRPGFLDWQTIRRGPWAHDVTYFLVSALDVVDRRQWEKALLAHYLARLEAHGVTAPDFDDAWLAYRQQIIWGLFFWAVNPLEFQPEVVDTVYSARFAMAAIDVGTREAIARVG